MRYALLICTEEKLQNELSEDEAAAQTAAYMAWGDAMGARGVLQGGERLRPTTSATTVRVRDGETLTSDGPFAETKEHLGGFYIIEAADLDAALAWASKVTDAIDTPIEVRPFMDVPTR